MREDDHLPGQRFLRQPLSDLPAAPMVQRRNGVVEHDAAAPLAESEFRQEGRDRDGSLLAFAENGRRRAAARHLQGKLELGLASGRLGLHHDAEVIDLEELEFSIEGISQFLAGRRARKLRRLPGDAPRLRTIDACLQLAAEFVLRHCLEHGGFDFGYWGEILFPVDRLVQAISMQRVLVERHLQRNPRALNTRPRRIRFLASALGNEADESYVVATTAFFKEHPFILHGGTIFWNPDGYVKSAWRRAWQSLKQEARYGHFANCLTRQSHYK